MPSTVKRQEHLSDSMLFIGCGLALGYWVLDSLMHYLMYDANFLHRLLGQDVQSVLLRVMVLCFFLIFGSHAQYTINLRRKVEADLKDSEARYRTIVESIEDGYFEVDLKGQFVFFNDSLCPILGGTRKQLWTSDKRDFFDKHFYPEVISSFQMVQQTGVAAKALDWVVTSLDGQRRHVETSLSPIFDEDGQTIGFRGILRDVTERHQTETLKRAKLAAESASRAKSGFLANMSHEIRTPLNAIIGLVELMLDGQLSEQQQEDLGVVRSSAYALLSVINDILDFSKIEAGKLELEKTIFQMSQLVGEALRIMAVKAHEKNLELVYRIAPELYHLSLVGDPTRFRQVLLNLIGNAIKFTDHGEVVVEVSLQERQSRNWVIHVEVRDTGIGIPAEKQAVIFQPFDQADGSTTRRYGGTGLGLAVSSQLVTLMGGRIWVHSHPGKGSVFHFTACLAKPEKDGPSERPAPTDDLKNRKFLVAVPNDSSRKFICEILQAHEIETEPAATASHIQNVMEKTATEERKPFDGLIMDTATTAPSQSVDTDGQQGFTPENQWMLPMVWLVPTMGPTDTCEHPNTLACQRLTKPVGPQELMRALRRLWGHEKSKPTPLSNNAQTAPFAPLPALSILVAEDTFFNQTFIKRLLDRWDCTTTIVSNGVQAVAAARKNSYDLILMDVQMPDMDGFEATARIRAEEDAAGRHTPIIALTAHAIKGDRERCLAAGMDGYVSKPISSEILLESIRELVPPVLNEKPPTPPAADESGQTHTVELDTASLLSAFDGDPDFFAELVDIFRTDYPPILEDLKQAIETEDHEQLRRSAHSLKGMLRNFQAESIAKIALALEEMSPSGSTDKARQQVSELEGQIGDLGRYLLELADNFKENPAGIEPK